MEISQNTVTKQIPTARRNSRQQRGVILGTADLVIVIPLFVLGVMLTGDAILLSIFKFKLCQVVAMSAAYAVELPPGEQVALKTKTMAKHLLQVSQMPIEKLRIKTELTHLDQTELIEIEIQGEFPLLKGFGLPLKVGLKERSAAPLPANQVHAVLGITPYPYSQSGNLANPTVYVPIIRPTNQMPVWSFPVDTSLSYMKVVHGDEPAKASNSQPSQHPSIY